MRQWNRNRVFRANLSSSRRSRRRGSRCRPRGVSVTSFRSPPFFALLAARFSSCDDSAFLSNVGHSFDSRFLSLLAVANFQALSWACFLVSIFARAARDGGKNQKSARYTAGIQDCSSPVRDWSPTIATSKGTSKSKCRIVH